MKPKPKTKTAVAKTKLASKARSTVATRTAAKGKLKGEAIATKTADSLETLARLVGKNIRTIHRHRQDPASPRPDRQGKHDVRAWVEYLAAHGRDSRQSDTTEIVELKTRKLLAEVEDRELRLALKRGEFIPVTVVRAEWTGNVARATAILRAKFESELPPILSGLDATGIQRECAKAVDEVLRTLHED